MTAAIDSLRETVHDAARRARAASKTLAQLTRTDKDAALHAAAEAVLAAAPAILDANAADIAAGRAAGMGDGLLDRLRLSSDRLPGGGAGGRAGPGVPPPPGG